MSIHVLMQQANIATAAAQKAAAERPSPELLEACAILFEMIDGTDDANALAARGWKFLQRMNKTS